MITWRFLNPVEAFDLLAQKDGYIQRLNPFNLSLHGVKSPDDYIKNLPQHLFDWHDEQIEKCQESLQVVSKNIYESGLQLDEEVGLILTSGKEMFNLEYTRGNAIVFPYAKISSLKNEKSDLFGFTETLITHELFHIISRKYPKIRTPLYKTFGFYELKKDFLTEAYPEQIINPDALEHRWAIDVLHKKTKTIITGFPLIRKDDWKTFLPINPDQSLASPIRAQETNLLEKINKQLTQYVSHPEEVAAEYFKLWLCYPQKIEYKEIKLFSDELKKQLSAI